MTFAPWIEAIQAHGHQIWVGLCVSGLILGFALCAGNLRRQILIGLMILLWGISQIYYEEFYSSVIARYAWFPYWVILEGIMIVTIFYIKNITAYLSSRLRLVSRKVKLEELRQEMIVTVMCLLSIMTNIGQLASAIIGTGGDTAVLYTFSNRLLLSMTVIALVLPGKRGLKALKDVFSEKFSKLVTGRFASNRSIDNL